MNRSTSYKCTKLGACQWGMKPANNISKPRQSLPTASASTFTTSLGKPVISESTLQPFSVAMQTHVETGRDRVLSSLCSSCVDCSIFRAVLRSILGILFTAQMKMTTHQKLNSMFRDLLSRATAPQQFEKLVLDKIVFGWMMLNLIFSKTDIVIDTVYSEISAFSICFHLPKPKITKTRRRQCEEAGYARRGPSWQSRSP